MSINDSKSPTAPQLIRLSRLHNTPRVVLESPYAGDLERNIRYAKAALLDSLERGEAPMASHLLYTQVWDDALPEVRARGISAGHAFIISAHYLVVYQDYGISPGMQLGIDTANILGRPIHYRNIL